MAPKLRFVINSYSIPEAQHNFIASHETHLEIGVEAHRQGSSTPALGQVYLIKG